MPELFCENKLGVYIKITVPGFEAAGKTQTEVLISYSWFEDVQKYQIAIIIITNNTYFDF